MSFRIHALPVEPFVPFFAMTDAALAAHRACRVVAEPESPCRVSLVDAMPGETLLLVNHVHQPAATPFQAAHAIYVREGAVQAKPVPGEVPDPIRRCTISLRGFDAEGMLRAAALVEGMDVANATSVLFGNEAITDVHLHYAAFGCYAARATRA